MDIAFCTFPGLSMKITSLSLLFAALVAFIFPPQDSNAEGRLEPTQKNVAYDDGNPAQKLDFYQAESGEPTPVVIFIHGGGWRAGSKSNVPGYLQNAVQDGLFSVVSVEYRFTDVATHPAQTDDCLRAVQFVRSKAKEWNIDPNKVGVTGGSAGGHLTLWVALHDDIADPKSDDSVERESSRATCAIGFAGPTDWSLLGEIEHGHPAYRQLVGHEPGTDFEEMDAAKMKSVSPITYASKDDPPVLIIHGDADQIVPVEHATRLQENLEKVDDDSELYIVEGGKHNVAGAGTEELGKVATKFFTEHLPVKAASE